MRSERHQGFTLAELLVVVAIIGIVAAVAVPLLSFKYSKKLYIAAEDYKLVSSDDTNSPGSRPMLTASYLLPCGASAPL